MSINDLLRTAEFLVDAEGNKKAVVVSYALWEELLTLLEDLEDAAEMQELLGEGAGETLPWEEAKERLRAGGIDV